MSEHQHKYKVTDYNGPDPGVVDLECECGDCRKGALNEVMFYTWQEHYLDHATGPLLYCPEAVDFGD